MKVSLCERWDACLLPYLRYRMAGLDVQWLGSKDAVQEAEPRLSDRCHAECGEFSHRYAQSVRVVSE